MTPREIVLQAVTHHETDVIPYILSIEPDVKKRLDAHYGGPEKFPKHSVFFASAGFNWRAKDLPGGGFRDVFGVEWMQGNIFHIIEPLLKQPSLKGFTFPTLISEADIPPLREFCEKHKDVFRQYNLGLLFWERAWALRGMENILMDLVESPAFVEELLDGLMQMHLDALDKLLPLPFDSIRFGDDFGAQKGLIMGLRYWRKYLRPRLAKMYGRARAAGKIVSIHSCGDNSEIMGDLIDIGVQIFNPAQPEANDLPALKKKFGRHITFEGGIGTQHTLPLGTPDEVRQEVRGCRRDLAPGGGLIMTTTKPIRPDVPTANAAACVEAIIAEAHKGSPR
jgi:uroporphyrinogen decarboxylase